MASNCKKSAALIDKIKACQLCAQHLPHEPRPVVQLDSQAKVLIAGQAPGRKVHETGLPFNDPSGDRLREWLGVNRQAFYDPKQFAIVPMGFCFPGTGKSGDLPPRPECALTWREQVMQSLSQVRLTLVIGRYAMDYHLPNDKDSVTETVRRWRETAPTIFPLPHPSPRNNIWLKRNPWFEQELLPELKQVVSQVLRKRLGR